MPPRSGTAIDQARTLLQERLRELDAERTQVERALADLGGRRGPGRPRGSGSTTTRRRRRRRGGTRAEQAAKMVESEPGIGAGEIAKRMEIAPNYMYRVMSQLEKEGRVSKQGRGYHPK